MKYIIQQRILKTLSFCFMKNVFSLSEKVSYMNAKVPDVELKFYEKNMRDINQFNENVSDTCKSVFT